MRISAKGRYGLAAMISMAEDVSGNDPLTVIGLSKKLGISKIYLEQVFSLLKKAGLVKSHKGAQGGYRLARLPQEITVRDILSELDQAIFESVGTTVATHAPQIDQAMQELIFDQMDQVMGETLERITLQDLLEDTVQRHNVQNPMYYI